MSKKIETTSCGCAVVKYVEGVPHVLLVRPFPDRDSWGIPKGHVDEGETFEACALRETLEEAGVNVVLIERLSPVKCTFKTERKTVIAYLARLSNPEAVPVAADGENVDIQFIPLENTPTIHVYQRPLLKELAERVSVLPCSTFG